jgi:DNA uptake protein ComE-like DNA-binding protein
MRPMRLLSLSLLTAAIAAASLPLYAQDATPAATAEVAAMAQPFTLLDLNTASVEDLMTIPGMTEGLTGEFEEYRPYVSISQFRQEIGKYIDVSELDAYQPYVYVPVQINDSDAATLQQIPGVTPEIADALMAARPYEDINAFLAALEEQLTPEQAAYGANFVEGYVKPFTLLNLNTATPEEFLAAIPDMTERMTREFDEYRPYISISQFRKEIGKYVDEAQVAAYEQYVYVPVQPNDSDSATVQQIPGVTEEIATALMDERPFATPDEFVALLSDYLTPAQAAYGANFVEGYVAPTATDEAPVATAEAQ